MKRSFTYLEHQEAWKQMDFVYAVDIDVAFVSYVGREILGDTVGTLHADNAFYDGSEVVGTFQKAWAVSAEPAKMWRQHDGSAAVLSRAVYETRPDSSAHVPVGQGKYYYAGGFYGGRVAHVRAFLSSLVSMTRQDLNKNIVAIFHDEVDILESRDIALFMTDFC
jgi:histo-blood group ABO system transferase